MFTSAVTVLAQTTSAGGRGLFRVFSAETIQRGSYIVNSFYQAYFQATDARGFGNDHSFKVGVTYGLTHSLELTAQIVPYQEDQEHAFGPPGDTQIGAKWRLPFSSQSLALGLRGFLSFPTALNHNVPFEPYSSGKLAGGVMGLLTWNVRGAHPLQVHANLGYFDHNITTPFASERTDQLLLGLGIKLPIHPLILYTEYTGEIFFNNDAVNFNDNSMRLTHGVKFIGPFKTIVDFGIDFGLSRNLNPPPDPRFVHEYADWKIFTGFSYQFNTRRVYGSIPKVTKHSSKKEETLLQEIKEKRGQAEEELEKMREELENKKPVDDHKFHEFH
jgi:hypothetical protein